MIHISGRARAIYDAYSYTKRFMYDSTLKLSNDVTHQRIEQNLFSNCICRKKNFFFNELSFRSFLHF